MYDKDKYTDAEGVRINFIVSENVNDVLNKVIPRGSKSDVYRALTVLFLQAIEEHGREFVIAVLDKRAKIVLDKN